MSNNIEHRSFWEYDGRPYHTVTITPASKGRNAYNIKQTKPQPVTYYCPCQNCLKGINGHGNLCGYCKGTGFTQHVKPFSDDKYLSRENMIAEDRLIVLKYNAVRFFHEMEQIDLMHQRTAENRRIFGKKIKW